MSTPHELAGELLQPILDLMSGADGGEGFAKLRHSFLPEMLEKAAAGPAPESEMVLMITRMSKLCEILMEKQ